jgi:ankyrin repeat protein
MNDGGTPLMSSAYNGHLEVVKFLLQSGADATKTSNGGETALDKAKQKKKTDVIKFLEVSGRGWRVGMKGGRKVGKRWRKERKEE